MSDFMKAMMEYATPGAQHALLGRKLGAWRLAVRFYGAPGVVAMESSGTSTYSWILGGRVLENLVVGDPGRPFEGRGYSGFDTRLGKYWFVWFDSMGTGVMRGQGAAGAARDESASIEWAMEATDIVQRSVKRARAVERFTSAIEWTSQSFETGPDGKEFVRSEFTYTRA